MWLRDQTAVFLVPILLGVVFATAGCGTDTPSTKTSPSGGPAATRQPRATSTPYPSPTFDPNATPSVPDDLPTPAVLMFCEPLQQAGHEGPGQPVAVVDDGATAVYQSGGCEPDIDAAGQLAVRNADGSMSRVIRTYTAAYTANTIVWTPARGDLNGTPTIMTAQFLKHDATVKHNALSAPFVVMNTTDDGAQIFGSLTRRIESPSNGLPIAIFLNGAPLRGEGGEIIAPRVQGEITDTLTIMALIEVDAERLAELLNAGKLN